MTRGKHWSSRRTASITFLLHSYLLSGLLSLWSGLRAFGRHSHPTLGPHYHEAESQRAWGSAVSQILNTPSSSSAYDALCPQQTHPSHASPREAP